MKNQEVKSFQEIRRLKREGYTSQELWHILLASPILLNEFHHNFQLFQIKLHGTDSNGFNFTRVLSTVYKATEVELTISASGVYNYTVILYAF